MVNVIGLGYIGLPTALALASNGIDVVGTDYNEDVAKSLNAGRITFEEKGLEDLFKQATQQGIKFTIQYTSTDFYIVSVPTPYKEKNKQLDTSFVINAIENILSVCMNDTIIVIESTISPGTIDKYIRPIIKKYSNTLNKEIHLAHAPERILPGNMLYELKNNPRTLGVDDYFIGEKVKKVYEKFCKSEITITDIRTAEMTKIVENTYRDINIAFANELTKICHEDSMNVYEIIRIANKHPRVNILQPGPGVGGHCISVDPWFLVGDHPLSTNLILQARKINDGMPEFVLFRISEIMKEKGINNLSKVGFYGLTYKEDVDDVRESPTLQILKSMEKHLATGVLVYDPYIKKDIVNNQEHNLESFINAVDMVVILVGHSEIRNNLEFLRNKIVLDTKGICNLPGVYRL